MSAEADGTILLAAPNGARRTKADHPNLPMTTEEIAAEALRCRDAGAAVFHLHVRDDTGAHSLDAGRYREAIAAIRENVGDDLVLQPTTEAVGVYRPEHLIALVHELEPEAVSMALKEIYPDGSDEAPVAALFAWMKERRIWAQIILYDTADIVRFIALHRRGLFANARPSVLLVLGRYTQGQRSDPGDLDPLLDALSPVRPDVSWAVCAFGPKENACMRHAIGEGGHVRVGFENNLYLPDGSQAACTADLVALAAEAARAGGRPPMVAASVRALIAGWF